MGFPFLRAPGWKPLLITSGKRVSARVISFVLVVCVISVTEHAIFEPEKVPWLYFNQISSLSRVVNVTDCSFVVWYPWQNTRFSNLKNALVFFTRILIFTSGKRDLRIFDLYTSDTFNTHFILKLLFRCTGTSRPTLYSFIYAEARVQVFRYFTPDTLSFSSDNAALSCTSSDTLGLIPIFL